MLSHNTELIRWVLVETSHPGNVGSAARALKTMAFDQLLLVNPKQSQIAQDPEAIALASGATDILDSSQELQTLDTAVQGCALVFGLTSRDREFGPPALNWQVAKNLIAETVQAGRSVALLFGPERTGLDNNHLALCTHRVWLDANPAYPSLNLAQAVMVCAFSLKEALGHFGETGNALFKGSREDLAEFADPAAIAAMLEHWQAGLIALGYLDPQNPKKLMPRLQALFARARLHKEEIDLLRGIAKQMLLRK